jgi:SPW repeat
MESEGDVVMPKQAGTRSWIDATNLVLGAILFSLAWVVGPATQAAQWNAAIVGGLVAFNAGCALVGFAAWEEWTNLILGFWAVITPWMFGFQADVGATTTYVIVGGVVAALAAVQLRLVNRQAPGLKA